MLRWRNPGLEFLVKYNLLSRMFHCPAIFKSSPSYNVLEALLIINPLNVMLLARGKYDGPYVHTLFPNQCPGCGQGRLAREGQPGAGQFSWVRKHLPW